MTTMTVRNRAYNPWTLFRDLEDAVCRAGQEAPESGAAWTPAVDLCETEDAYLIEADVPGVRQEDLAITVHEDTLTLKGERKRGGEMPDNGYRRVERRFGAFERRFRLPRGIDADKVNARFAHGVLTITVPKQEEAKPRQINVSVN
jgi:HSP20 family protein